MEEFLHVPVYVIAVPYNGHLYKLRNGEQVDGKINSKSDWYAFDEASLTSLKAQKAQSKVVMVVTCLQLSLCFCEQFTLRYRGWTLLFGAKIHLHCCQTSLPTLKNTKSYQVLLV